MLTWPMASLGWVTSIIQRAAASQERINEFLRIEPEIYSASENKIELKGKIEFDHVSFVYPDSGIKALDDVSFVVEPGKSLAVLGRTGSGKSTIANLIVRMYDVTGGRILVDDNLIESLSLQGLRENIGYVPQDVFLFSDTIANNIAFGLTLNREREKGRNGETEMNGVPVPPFSDSLTPLIEEAARDAVIYDNIITFPKGFETMIGERGIMLSGGQKQRVSIARALIKNPKILVFDDCLSAVDTHTEELILNNLKKHIAGRTSVIISHRVSSVKHADKIIVLDNGRIVESGTNDSLIEKKGVYFELYEKQLLEEENA